MTVCTIRMLDVCAATFERHGDVNVIFRSLHFVFNSFFVSEENTRTGRNGKWKKKSNGMHIYILYRLNRVKTELRTWTRCSLGSTWRRRWYAVMCPYASSITIYLLWTAYAPKHNFLFKFQIITERALPSFCTFCCFTNSVNLLWALGCNTFTR